MAIRRDIISAAIATIVFAVLLGLAYPLVITGVSQGVFPGNANGQLIYSHGKLVGSKLIGQQFADQTVTNGKPQVDKNGNPVTTPDARYFQSRPSATVPPDNAAGSAFSNLGSNNVATEQALSANVQAYLTLEKAYVPGLTAARVPVDAANNSASGVDYEISLANARIQAQRIATQRHLTLARTDALIARYTSGRTVGVFGEPGVNVLELNLALDRLTGGKR
jgi:potassium-transporting ATPase KdpC subunit